MTIAALGGSVEIPTLDGSEPVQIEPGTQAGEVIRLKGKGMPRLQGRGRGEIVDIEVRLQVRQPWETWPLIRGLPRLEVLYNSIHYLDAIRALVGEPRGV